MYKQIVFAICGCLFLVNGFSQTKNLEELLNEIEQNNIELKGYQSFIESQQLKNKSTNNLPDPQFSGYYLPFGDNATGNSLAVNFSTTGHSAVMVPVYAYGPQADKFSGIYEVLVYPSFSSYRSISAVSLVNSPSTRCSNTTFIV